jgi:predicted DNA binding CopG/RHH family protein
VPKVANPKDSSITTRLSVELRAQIDERAAVYGLTASEFLRYLAVSYFDARE